MESWNNNLNVYIITGKISVRKEYLKRQKNNVVFVTFHCLTSFTVKYYILRLSWKYRLIIFIESFRIMKRFC